MTQYMNGSGLGLQIMMINIGVNTQCTVRMWAVDSHEYEKTQHFFYQSAMFRGIGVNTQCTIRMWAVDSH